MKDEYIRNTIISLITTFLILLTFVLTHGILYYILGAMMIVLIGLQSVIKAELEICEEELKLLSILK
jgi:hypothetical protein